MSAIPERRRRRLVAAVAAMVAAIVALPLGLWVGADTLLNSTDGQNVGATNTLSIPATPAALVVGVNARDEVTMMAMFALAPGGSGGTIISFPVGTTATVGTSGTIHRLADTYATGGIDALTLDVEGTFNITFSVVAKMTAGDLASLLTPIGTRTVVLERPVRDTDPTGETVVVVSRGEQALSPGTMAAALVAAPVGAPEEARLPVIAAIWSAVAGSQPEDPAGTTTSTTLGAPGQDDEVPADIESFFAAMRGGQMRAWQFQYELLVDAARNPAGLDLYGLDGGEVIMVLASVAPSSLSVATNNVSFLVDSPFADPAITKEAVVRLAYVGANVLLVREIDGPPAARTVVRYNDDLVRADVEATEVILGPLEFERTDETIERINAHLILGEDFKAFLAQNSGLPSTTSTSSPTATTAVPGA